VLFNFICIFLDKSKLSLTDTFFEIVIETKIYFLSRLKYIEKYADTWRVLILSGIEYNVNVNGIPFRAMDSDDSFFNISRVSRGGLYSLYHKLTLHVTNNPVENNFDYHFTSKFQTELQLEEVGPKKYRFLPCTTELNHARLICKSGFGSVYEVFLPGVGFVVVKFFSGKMLWAMDQEHKILVHLNQTKNEFIQYLHGTGTFGPSDGNYGFIVSTLYQKGDLSYFLKNISPSNDLAYTLETFILILKGLDFLHKQCIAHLDIKGPNITVDSRNMPKIIDFGISKKIGKLLEHSGFYTRPNRPPIICLFDYLYETGIPAVPSMDIWAILIELLKSISDQKLPSLTAIRSDDDLNKVYKASVSFDMIQCLKPTYGGETAIKLSQIIYPHLYDGSNVSDLLRSLNIDAECISELIEIIKSWEIKPIWMHNLIEEALVNVKVDDDNIKDRLRTFFRTYLDVNENILGLDIQQNNCAAIIQELEAFFLPEN
jgi:serine/threonine protein kinase